MTRRARWPIRVALLAVAVPWVVVGAGATPAAAHSISGAQASNYQTRIGTVQPSVAGLRIEVVDAGEPYLRVGLAGCSRAAAPHRNRVRTSPVPVPAQADPAAPLEWCRLGGDDEVAWYDHRASWMEPGDPPAVRAAPDRSHLVIPSWQVELRVGGQPVRVIGDVRWVPGSSPWPWVAAASGCPLAVLVAIGRRPGLVAGLVCLLAAVDVVHTVGVWGGTSASVAAKAYGSLPSVVGWALAVLAVRRLLGPDPDRAGVSLLLTAVVLGMVGGRGDLDSLSRSQLASSLPAPVTRAWSRPPWGSGPGWP